MNYGLEFFSIFGENFLPCLLSQINYQQDYVMLHLPNYPKNSLTSVLLLHACYMSLVVSDNKVDQILPSKQFCENEWLEFSHLSSYFRSQKCQKASNQGGKMALSAKKIIYLAQMYFFASTIFSIFHEPYYFNFPKLKYGS